MNTFQLHTEMPRRMTMIPNDFLDHYMAKANGEFLKIYLYLLRWADDPNMTFTTASIADFFNMTENDVKRAFRFWEQENLLTISWDRSDNISSLCLKTISIPKTSTMQNATLAPASVSQTSSDAIPSYPMEDLQDFIENKDGHELFIILQEYTGKPLNPKDMNTVLFFYRELDMSIELIEYLFEYCLSNGHRRMSYIQAVAIGWANAGISNVEEAKSYTATFNQLNTAVINAFGIKNRFLSDEEQLFIRKWNKEMQFSQDLIVEACKRTILTAHSASFKYANSILERWHKNNVQNLTDVQKLDKDFEKSKAERAAKQAENQPASTANVKKPASRFHNFNQRSYDYGKMEMEFVKKLQERKQH